MPHFVLGLFFFLFFFLDRKFAYCMSVSEINKRSFEPFVFVFSFRLYVQQHFDVFVQG